MESTLDTCMALQAQCEHNASTAGNELESARLEGEKAAIEARNRGEMLMLMDECSANDIQNAYAIGWNSVSPKSM